MRITIKLIFLLIFISIILNIYFLNKINSERKQCSSMYILSLDLAKELKCTYASEENEEKVLQISRMINVIEKLEEGESGLESEIATLIAE